VVATSDYRPIVIKSHLAKIREKAILNKIKAGRDYLVKKKSYQTGFQQKKSTLNNLIEVISRITK